MVVTRLPDAAALAALLVGLGLDVRAPREGLLSAEVPLGATSVALRVMWDARRRALVMALDLPLRHAPGRRELASAAMAELDRRSSRRGFGWSGDGRRMVWQAWLGLDDEGVSGGAVLDALRAGVGAVRRGLPEIARAALGPHAVEPARAAAKPAAFELVDPLDGPEPGELDERLLGPQPGPDWSGLRARALLGRRAPPLDSAWLVDAAVITSDGRVVGWIDAGDHPHRAPVAWGESWGDAAFSQVGPATSAIEALLGARGLALDGEIALARRELPAPPPAEVSLRPATPADEPALRALIAEVRPHLERPRVGEGGLPEAAPWEDHAWTLVAERGGEAIGLVSLAVDVDAAAGSVPFCGLLPAWRGRGLAREVYLAALASLHAAGAERVSDAASNLAMRRVYAAVGCDVWATVRRYRR